MTYIIGDDKIQVATIRVALRPSEMTQLRLALQTDKFGIDVRMGKKNAELIRVEDQSPMDKIKV